MARSRQPITRRQRAVPRRDHDPEPRPRQPRAEQIRGPPADRRALTPVPLGPHPRLDDPRPIHPPAAPPIVAPSPERPPDGPCGPNRSNPRATNLSNTTSARILPSERSTHSSILGKDESISFGRSAIAPGTGNSPASRMATQSLDGVMGTAGQLAGVPEQLVRSNASRISMTSSRDFTCSSWSTSVQHRQSNQEERPPGGPGRATDFNEGRTTGRQRAVLMATTGQLRGRLRAGSHGRRQVTRNHAEWVVDYGGARL